MNVTTGPGLSYYLNYDLTCDDSISVLGDDIRRKGSRRFDNKDMDY